MLLNLASCLAIPAGVLDGQSLQEWSRVFMHRDHRPPLISIISSPHQRSQTEFLLFFDCLFELAQPSLEDLKWIFACGCVEKCEKWFNHIFGLLSSLSISCIAPYLTEILHI